MDIWIVYLVIAIQAILFLLYFTGKWVVVEFFQLLCVVFYQIFQSFVQIFVSNRKSLRGEVVLLTGAASGIGRLTALRLAKKGCRLVLWDINIKALEGVAKEIKESGGEVNYYECDVRKPEEVYKVGDKVKKEIGDVTLLINNAGVVTGKKLLDCSDEDIRRTYEVNTFGHYWTIKCFLPAMIAKNKGHITAIASVAGYFGLVGCVDYCGSKFATVGLMEALRREVHGMDKMGIIFTTVCPFFIQTGMFAGVSLRYPSLPGFAPLEPEYVADKIVYAIETNQDTVFLPKMSKVSYYAQTFLPAKSSDMLIRFLGGDEAMDTFIGSRQPEKITN